MKIQDPNSNKDSSYPDQDNSKMFETYFHRYSKWRENNLQPPWQVVRGQQPKTTMASGTMAILPLPKVHSTIRSHLEAICDG